MYESLPPLFRAVYFPTCLLSVCYILVSDILVPDKILALLYVL